MRQKKFVEYHNLPINHTLNCKQKPYLINLTYEKNDPYLSAVSFMQFKVKFEKT